MKNIFHNSKEILFLFRIYCLAGEAKCPLALQVKRKNKDFWLFWKFNYYTTCAFVVFILCQLEYRYTIAVRALAMTKKSFIRLMCWSCTQCKKVTTTTWKRHFFGGDHNHRNDDAWRLLEPGTERTRTSLIRKKTCTRFTKHAWIGSRIVSYITRSFRVLT